MANVVIAGDTSGTITIRAPAVAGSPILSLPTTTSTFTTAATVTGQAIGFVNRLRNGNFVIWPNGTSGTTAVSATGYTSISASGWIAITTGATVSWSQVTSGSNGSAQSLKITGATSITDVTLAQRIESYDAATLAGQTCTFQITVTNNTGSTITPTLATRYAGSTDTWTSPVADLAATNLQSITNGSTATLAYTFTASSNAVNGYEVKIDFGNNFGSASNSVTVTAADLRVTPTVSTGQNSSPPTPEFRPIDQMEKWCARYFQTTYNNGVAPGTASSYGGMVGTNTTQVSGTYFGLMIRFDTPMRATPTINFWDYAGNASKTSQYFTASPASGMINNAGAFTVDYSGTKGYLANQSNNNSGLIWHHVAYADFW